ncbi:hypothetical protein K435DRAFT_674985 [Dendrothele bispora CBS 962.96]|uniref:Helicase ATP-binding domain-containing protein n=1 Tax=Dendrothele bispora (strain CBS 962.96) TaxID=1314807 RepID=A0A4V4HEG3_DENBC|nr:hypothetical protein K435DRAFT_674985 [Dendrothele bispora CBS 962.96]
MDSFNIQDSRTQNQTPEWTIKSIKDLVQKRTGKRPCWWQNKTAMALYNRKDIMGVARTGAGKTMSFWIALMMAQERGQLKKTVVVVTPLNLLGKQNVIQLNDGILSAFAVNRDNATPETFKSLWSNSKFTSTLFYFVYDEGHCASQWGQMFHNQYLHVVGLLHYLIPDSITIYVLVYVASATLPSAILRDVTHILHLCSAEL